NRALVQGSARAPGRTRSAGRREHGPGHVARRAPALPPGGDPPALTRAGVRSLIGLPGRQHIVLGRRAEPEREAPQGQRPAEPQGRATADRLALAQSLHDDLGHSLSLVALNLGRLEIDPALPESARTSLLHARNDLAHAVERLGDSVSDLRSGAPV